MNKDLLEISKTLENYNSLFRLFWEIGNIQFSDTLSTAAISFDNIGNALMFLFNEDFWNSLDLYTKTFITCHEMLHILLNHGYRMVIHTDNEKANIAMDIVVNHLLINKFGFDREKLCVDWKNYCWVDTIFTENIPLTNKSFEYYYALIENKDIPSKSLFDSHDITGEANEEINNFISKNILPEDIDSELEDILNKSACVINAGFGEGSWKPIKLSKKFKRWELIVPSSKKINVIDTRIIDTWSRENKRTQFVLDDDLYLPGKHRYYDKFLELKMSEIWFFLDYSGSCVSFFEDFISAALALNSKKFITKLFTFDTLVQEINITDDKSIINVYGGGGTDFNCISKYIEHKIKTEPAPSAYFIITDGFSTGRFCTTEPLEKFHWFLVKNGSTQYIPKQCTVHALSDYLIS